MAMLSPQDQQAVREAFSRGDEGDAYWVAHYAGMSPDAPMCQLPLGNVGGNRHQQIGTTVAAGRAGLLC